MNLSWYERAECRGMDPDMFFPLGSTAVEDVAKIKCAKAACARCPVRGECLNSAIDAWLRYGKFGIWGGLTEDERAAERRRRMRRVA